MMADNVSSFMVLLSLVVMMEGIGKEKRLKGKKARVFLWLSLYFLKGQIRGLIR
jgi:hypothetical protein